jgi:hypothetical protein
MSELAIMVLSEDHGPIKVSPCRRTKEVMVWTETAGGKLHVPLGSLDDFISALKWAGREARYEHRAVIFGPPATEGSDHVEG